MAEARKQRIALADVGKAIMVVCDPAGEVLGCTPAAEALMTELSQRGWESRSRLPAALWQSLEQARAEEWGPVEWMPGDGEHCLGVSRFPLGGDRWLVSMREISSRKRNLAQQVYRGTMQVSAGIVAQAAHDLRSPLASMTFNAAVLRKRWRELPPQQVDNKLAEISACCEWQEHAIASLVELGYSSRHVVIGLGDLFERLGERLQPAFRAGDNQLQVDVDAEIQVRGTRFTLEHIFSNLIMNAVEATADPVTVTIHSPRRAELRGPLIAVRVEDDGPGIPNKIRGRIFDPFFSTKLNGTGVGLCMAREAARQIGGDLRLLSSAAKKIDAQRGTSFEVRLQVGKP
jgi:signal transduction histidine kinase